VIPTFEAELLPRIKDYHYNIILTGRMGFVYEAIKDDSGKITNYEVVDHKAKLTSEMAHEPDLVIEMEQLKNREGLTVEVSQQAVVLKDRSGIIHGKSCINPDWKFFKPVWDFLAGSDLPAMPDADKSNNADLLEEGEKNTEENRLKEIALEEIKGVFDRAGFGNSGADKANKSTITLDIFGTVSGTAISAMSSDTLNEALSKLENDERIKCRIKKETAA
jgi:hypothetical protein